MIHKHFKSGKKQGNFRQIRTLCKSNEEKARFFENKILKGLPEKIQELLANEQELTDEEIDILLADYGEEITDESQEEKVIYKKEVKKITVDDCVIAYSGSGDKINYIIDECIIPEKYKSMDQMKEVISKFDDVRRAKEEQERKEKEAAELKAKEEEKRKTALKGSDLLEWLDNSIKYLEDEKQKENNAKHFFNSFDDSIEL